MPIIAISGHPGAGKTVLAEKLAKALGYENFYMGRIFRDLAEEKGLTIEEFYKKMAANPELEKMIDADQVRLMKTKDNLIIQGRMTPFMPSSFSKINVLLKVYELEGARRQTLRPENKSKGIEGMLVLSRERLEEERRRYRKLYGIKNHLDEKYFDIVIDTTEMTPGQVFEAVLEDLRHPGIIRTVRRIVRNFLFNPQMKRALKNF